MEKIINEKIPIGTSRSEVMTFLNTFKIGSRSVRFAQYYSGRPKSSWTEDSQPPNVHGHISASIIDAETSQDGFFTYRSNLMMTFYFDKSERLIGDNLYNLPGN